MKPWEAAALLVVMALIVLLTGCATPDPVIVRVPVTVPCLGPAPAVPEYLAGVGDYPGDAQAIKLLGIDLTNAKLYADQLKAQMAGCK